MFQVEAADVQAILRDYGISASVTALSELLRYHYEKYDPASREVRLILKAELEGHDPVVIKFLNEEDLSEALLDSQSAFSEYLRQNGISTAQRYSCQDHFVKNYFLCGNDVYVMVEDFMPGQLAFFTPDLAEQAGRLMAQTHDLAESGNCHVDYDVLFNPLEENDLFSISIFEELTEKMDAQCRATAQRILGHSQRRLAALQPLASRNKYAVQGDFSDCNLYLNPDGSLGLFDFNNCGDNYLLGDVVMQGIFISRLMDYRQPWTEDFGKELLKRYFCGYWSLRPFTEEDAALFPHIYAITTTFWNMQIRFDDRCLANLLEQEDHAGAAALLAKMEQQIQSSVSI